MVKIKIWIGSFFLLFAWAGHILAQDSYYYVALKDLKITQGEWPTHNTHQASVSPRSYLYRQSDFTRPYAVGDNYEEIYFACDDPRRWYEISQMPEILSRSNRYYLAIKQTSERIPVGRLFIPINGGAGMTYLDFTLNDQTTSTPDAKAKFLQAREQYYRQWASLGIPGGAWFRHQANETKKQIDAEAQPAAAAAKSNANPNINPNAIPRPRPPQPGGPLAATFSLWGGGRAMSENLQLDRDLQMVVNSDSTIDLAGIEGITTGEIKWQDIIVGMNPKKDFLAVAIPADQHALFFPSFQAMMTLKDEAGAQGTPIQQLLEIRAEDALTPQRYQKQLCLMGGLIAQLLGPELITSAALTGSDPYLRVGSDVAVLFAAADAEALEKAVRIQQLAAKTSCPDAKTVTGRVAEVPYHGVVSPDRSICSYQARLDKIVVVTNSLYQLEQIVKADKGQIPAIASLDEYTFFRDRYPLGDADETALLVLSDATIRRWCGPRWRIADSRRTRAQAVLTELQAQYLDQMVSGKVTSGPLALARPIEGLGDLQITPTAVCSSVYGSLNFMTPIAEIPLEKVSAEEAQAYQRWQSGYQRNWRGIFDPIAVRFSVQSHHVGLDVTVRPLIEQNQYRELIEVTGKNTISPDAGDRHSGTMFHAVMSVNANSPTIRNLGNFGMGTMQDGEVSIMGVPIQTNNMSWLGRWASLYAEQDPFWDELSQALQVEHYMAFEKFLLPNLHRLPLVLQADVANPMTFATFVVSVRAFVESSVPGMTLWQMQNYNGHPYVKITMSPQNPDQPSDFKDLAICYAALPNRLIITPSETLLQQALDRQFKTSSASLPAAAATDVQAQSVAGIPEKEELPAKPAEGNQTPPPTDVKNEWLGKNLSMEVKSSARRVVEAFFTDILASAMQRRAWGNIPILNEWHQRYPQQQPVEFHERFWQTRLISPGGGDYVWNDEFKTMESTLYGHPGQPKQPKILLGSFLDIDEINMGLTFENQGLRARTEITRLSGNESSTPATAPVK